MASADIKELRREVLKLLFEKRNESLLVTTGYQRDGWQQALLDQLPFGVNRGRMIDSLTLVVGRRVPLVEGRTKSDPDVYFVLSELHQENPAEVPYIRYRTATFSCKQENWDIVRVVVNNKRTSMREHRGFFLRFADDGHLVNLSEENYAQLQTDRYLTVTKRFNQYVDDRADYFLFTKEELSKELLEVYDEILLPQIATLFE